MSPFITVAARAIQTASKTSLLAQSTAVLGKVSINLFYRDMLPVSNPAVTLPGISACVDHSVAIVLLKTEMSVMI